MNKSYLIGILLLEMLFSYGCVNTASNLDGITGEAVREQANTANTQEEVQPETIVDTSNVVEAASNGVCGTGFGLVRKTINPDGSVEEYCFDPCDGNQKCIDNWGVIDEVDFVSGPASSGSGSSASPGTTNGPGNFGAGGEANTVSGGGSERKAR